MAFVEVKEKEKGAHPIKTKVRIYRLLCSGWTGRSIARYLKINESAVRGHIQRLTKEGLIERITKKPAFYQKKEKSAHPLSYSALAHPSNDETARMLPAKFGANFLLIVKRGARTAGLKFNSRGTATIKEEGSVPHTFQLHRYKAQLWLHSGAFRGNNPNEIIEKGKAQIMALAAFYEAKFGIILTLSRFYEGEEWVMVSAKMSQETAQSAGIERGGQLEVGESIHKFADFSHPESFQFNTRLGAQNANSARDDARMHRYLYERLGDDIEKMAKGMLATADAVVAVRMGQEILAKEIKELRGKRE